MVIPLSLGFYCCNNRKLVDFSKFCGLPRLRWKVLLLVLLGVFHEVTIDLWLRLN
jgi:hypothetical protein